MSQSLLQFLNSACRAEKQPHMIYLKKRKKKKKEHGRVPVKLSFQKQAAGKTWHTGHSLPSPCSKGLNPHHSCVTYFASQKPAFDSFSPRSFPLISSQPCKLCFLNSSNPPPAPHFLHCSPCSLFPGSWPQSIDSSTHSH